MGISIRIMRSSCISKYLEQASDGNGSLFLGAGLAHILCDEMGTPHYDDLTLISSRYLVNALQQQLWTVMEN